MAAPLRLTLLGEATATLGGKPLPGLSSRKALALLFYLAVTGRTHTRSSLAGLLWPDTPEANARMNLRKELSRLRHHGSGRCMLGPAHAMPDDRHRASGAAMCQPRPHLHLRV